VYHLPRKNLGIYTEEEKEYMREIWRDWFIDNIKLVSHQQHH
jgi:hypothetical protein